MTVQHAALLAVLLYVVLCVTVSAIDRPARNRKRRYPRDVLPPPHPACRREPQEYVDA